MSAQGVPVPFSVGEEVSGMVQQRVASLDILRGLAVIGMIVVNAAAGLQRFAIPPAFLHSHWIGLTLADLVFPAFVFMVGVSIAVAMPVSGQNRVTAQRIMVRSLRLIVLGLLLTNIYWLADYDANTFRWCGVLQRIGVVFLVVAPLQVRMSTRALAVLAVVLLAGYSLLCFLPVPDGTPVDLRIPGANIAAWIDRTVFATHIYVHGPLGYDPEGLLSTIPAIAQACLGVVAGRGLRQPRAGLRFMAAGIAMAVVALLVSWIIPICKDLWSASFVLITSGITLATLGLLHETVDTRSITLPLASICTAFGVNAIAAYVLHYVTSSVLGWKSMDAIHALAASLVGESLAFMFPILIFLGGIAGAMLSLRKRGWVMKL